MPCLRELNIMEYGPTGNNIQLLSEVTLLSLQSLDLRGADLRNVQLLQGYTQLKKLSLSYRDLKGIGAVAHLTGLTKLELDPSGCRTRQLFSPEDQSELGSALAALTNLKCLSIDHAPPGPVTEALSQLTALTELSFSNQGRVLDPGPLVLPSVLSLIYQLSDITVKHLVCIEAPLIRYLQAGFAPQPGDLDTLRWLNRGLLKACSSLWLDLQQAWSKEGTVALMTVLHQDWQPSAEALQPSTSGITDSPSSGQWELFLWEGHCSRQCLSLLPKGLNCLHLR
jgi:hypothetical protein